jgi:hypothetical protein
MRRAFYIGLVVVVGLCSYWAGIRYGATFTFTLDVHMPPPVAPFENYPVFYIGAPPVLMTSLEATDGLYKTLVSKSDHVDISCLYIEANDKGTVVEPNYSDDCIKRFKVASATK